MVGGIEVALRNSSSLTLPVMQASIRFQGRGCSSPRGDWTKFSMDEVFDHRGTGWTAQSLLCREGGRLRRMSFYLVQGVGVGAEVKVVGGGQTGWSASLD